MSMRDLNEGGSQSSQATPFELRVLGHFELVFRETGALIPVPTAKTRALLAYLAAAPRFTETRRRLAGLLWANSGEDQARQSMRQLLSNFRRGASLGESGIIIFDESTVSLNPALVAIDRAALMAERPDAEMAELSRIADLYRNDFGLGLDIGESDFDAWLQTERVRCRDAAITLFDRLVRALIGLGRHEEALTRANRLAEIDPTREETHRLVIAEEAIVSGRASAMLRYEAFRLHLKDELGVRPQPATLRLLDELRRQPNPDGPPDASTDAGALAATPAPVARLAARRWRQAAVATGLAFALLLGVVIAAPAWHLFEAPIAYIDDDTGRASIVMLPFETAPGHDDLRAHSQAYEAEARVAFAHNNRLSMVEFSDTAPSHDPIGIGRAMRARYVIKTILTEVAGGLQADVSLIDSATGVTVSIIPVPVSSEKIKFARELARSIYPEIVQHRAQTLSAIDPDSIPALLWRGTAAQIATRVGAANPEEFTLYERVLARDPNQLYALLGLAEALIVQVSRDQSPDRTADINRATSLLLRVREQAPNLPDIALDEGMLCKLQRQYAQAVPLFERAVQLDRTQWNAAANAAHVKIFLGRFEEAYDQMEAVMPNLLPDFAAAETGYLAGETALVARHPEQAVAYLDIAIRGNATVSRIHALHAAALWMAGHQAEAHAAAVLSQTLKPVYSPEMMARRGGAEASSRYKAARDDYVAAFRSALAPVPTN
jgi:DNA-binding SARP family transcriptional activator/Flp pilus assembly protein TadD